MNRRSRDEQGRVARRSTGVGGSGIVDAGRWWCERVPTFPQRGNGRTSRLCRSRPRPTWRPWRSSSVRLDQTVYAAAGNRRMVATQVPVSTSRSTAAHFTFVSTGMNKDKINVRDPWAMLIDPIHPIRSTPTTLRQRIPPFKVDQRRRRLDRSLGRIPRGKTSSFVQAIAMDPAIRSTALTFHSTCQRRTTVSACRARTTAAPVANLHGPTQLTRVAGSRPPFRCSAPRATSMRPPAADGYTGDEGKTWSNG